MWLLLVFVKLFDMPLSASMQLLYDWIRTLVFLPKGLLSSVASYCLIAVFVMLEQDPSAIF